MVSRKRGREEMEAPAPEPAQEPTKLQKLRNTWELANLMQYIFFFGKALKIDEDLDIDDLEQECLKPEKSKVLNEIGLALLKFVSSHRGLTPELFDEYTRRQYVAKAPQRNPFGEEEEPNKFVDFDVFLKLKVLVQLSQWTLINADRMREKMPDVKEADQTQWRIEETGWDRDERSYLVLDDNRLYRRTDPLPPPEPVAKAKPKTTSKKGKAAARASRRRKATEVEDAEDAHVDTGAEYVEEAEKTADDDGLGGRKWECLAVTLDEYREFLASIEKSRNPDEKALHKRITETALPEIEKLEASHLRKKQKQERELLNMQKLATAKRSSRLEAKFEREKQEQEAADAERKKREDLAAAKRDQEKQKSMEAARESRMMTREQRLKDREFKRLLHEEELANLSEENKKIEAGESQRSERHLKAEMEKKKKDLAALQEEEDWVFDCARCGVYGNNLDDGSPSIACEKCNVWQHTACLGISPEEAKKDDFRFVCRDCKRREEDAKKPKIPTLKFHLGSSSSPPQSQSKPVQPATNGIVTNGVKRKSGESGLPPMKKFKPSKYQSFPQAGSAGGGYHQPAQPYQNGMHETIMNGPNLSPEGQIKKASPANSTPRYPNTQPYPRPTDHTSPRFSHSPKKSSFGTHGTYQGQPNYNHSVQGKAADSEMHDPMLKSYHSNTAYEAQKHQPYGHPQYPHPADSPSSHGNYQTSANGHQYQATHGNYQQQGGNYVTPNGAHKSYQSLRGYGQPNGPPTSGWSAQYHPPNHSPSQRLPPYTQSPSANPAYERNPDSQPPSNHSHPASTSSASYHSNPQPTPNTHNRPTSSHATTGSKDPPFISNHTSASPLQHPPTLTPGPRTAAPLANGHTYPPLPNQTTSPTKHPSPPTSFTQNPPPATSPISYQPPPPPHQCAHLPWLLPAETQPPSINPEPFSASSTPSPPSPRRDTNPPASPKALTERGDGDDGLAYPSRRPSKACRASCSRS